MKETEIGKIPAEWDVRKIKEISERVSVGYVGITSKYFTNAADGIPLLRSQNIRNGKINFANLLFVTKEFHYANKKSILQTGDVLVVRVGENRGDTCILKNEFIEVNCANIVFFRPQKEYGKFIELFLRSPYGQFILEALTTGSAQGVINTTSIAEIAVPFPSLKEATVISEIFESIENKIELLNRQNKTLEQLAETLFRQWFVEEAEEGWEIVCLKNLIELQRGISYSGSTLGINGNGIPMHSLNSIDINGSYKYDGIKYYTGEVKENKKLMVGDLLILNTDITQDNRIIGWPIFVPEIYPESVCTHHLYSVTLLTDKISKFYLYFLLRYREYRDTLANAANGTTVSMLSKDAIGSLEIKIPPKEKRIIFEEAVRNFLDKQTLNQQQINSLTQLRDTLLPKLMSGEVRVDN